MAKADEKGPGRFHHCVECCSLLHSARLCLKCSPLNDSLRSRTQVSDYRNAFAPGVSCREVFKSLAEHGIGGDSASVRTSNACNIHGAHPAVPRAKMILNALAMHTWAFKVRLRPRALNRSNLVDTIISDCRFK
jgi:hypothetical protein